MSVPEIVNYVSPSVWWDSQSERLTDTLLTLIDQLLSATSSNAEVESDFYIWTSIVQAS